MLIEALVKAADATGVPWEHVVTEVESAPTDIMTAKAKMLLFSNAAEELSRRHNRPVVRVFRLPIRYRQPILHIEQLASAREHEVPEWLLYAPRSIGGRLVEENGKVIMTRPMATELLDTLLIKGYAHAFAHSAEYVAYIRKMFDEYVAQLPEQLALEDNPRALVAI